MSSRSFTKRALRKAFVVTVTAATPLLGCEPETTVNPPPLPVECTAERFPMEGEECASDGDICETGDCFGSPTQMAECVGGLWRVSDLSCNPPPNPDAGVDAGVPDGDAGAGPDADAPDASN